MQLLARTEFPGYKLQNTKLCSSPSYITTLNQAEMCFHAQIKIHTWFVVKGIFWARVGTNPNSKNTLDVNFNSWFRFY